jgi:hypothetical protein
MRFRWSIRRGADSTARSAPKLASTIGWRRSSEPILPADPSESELQRFQQRKAQRREEIQARDLDLDKLKTTAQGNPASHSRKSTAKEDCFARLRTERKHFIDTLKMIAYRA